MCPGKISNYALPVPAAGQPHPTEYSSCISAFNKLQVTKNTWTRKMPNTLISQARLAPVHHPLSSHLPQSAPNPAATGLPAAPATACIFASVTRLSFVSYLIHFKLLAAFAL